MDGIEKHFDPFSRAKKCHDAKRPTSAGHRALGQCRYAGHAVGNHPNPFGIETLALDVGGHRLRNGYYPLDAPQTQPLDQCVDPIPPSPGRIVQSGAVGVIHHRHARQGRRHAADHGRSHGVAVDDAIVLLPHNLRHAPGGPEIKTRHHRHVEKRGRLRLTQFVEQVQFDASEADGKTQFGQAPANKSWTRSAPA